MAGASGLTASDAVLDAVRRALPSDGSFLVALSGGPDSAVVAWAVESLFGPERTRGVHVHHGQPASDDLHVAALAVAAELEIGLQRVDVVVPDGASFEARAREVRLAALEDAARPGEWIVAGHHAGDSVETVLTNLLRGAGATGLSGIASARGRWLRPLIEVEADLVRTTANELGLPYMEDPGQPRPPPPQKPHPFRGGALAQRAVSISPWAGWCCGRRGRWRRTTGPSRRSPRRCRSADEAGTITVPGVVLTTVPRAVAARVARRALRRAHPPYPGTAEEVDAVLGVAAGSAPRRGLTGGAHGRARGRVGRDLRHRSCCGEPRDDGAGREGGLRPLASPRRARSAQSPVPLWAGPEFASWLQCSTTRWRCASRMKASGSVTRRRAPSSWRDAMAEGGVPVRLRSAWPVVAAGAKIAWVAGSASCRMGRRPGVAQRGRPWNSRSKGSLHEESIGC